MDYILLLMFSLSAGFSVAFGGVFLVMNLFTFCLSGHGAKDSGYMVIISALLAAWSFGLSCVI